LILEFSATWVSVCDSVNTPAHSIRPARTLLPSHRSWIERKQWVKTITGILIWTSAFLSRVSGNRCMTYPSPTLYRPNSDICKTNTHSNPTLGSLPIAPHALTAVTRVPHTAPIHALIASRTVYTVRAWAPAWHKHGLGEAEKGRQCEFLVDLAPLEHIIALVSVVDR
jgi:hypothetical protein